MTTLLERARNRPEKSTYCVVAQSLSTLDPDRLAEVQELFASEDVIWRIKTEIVNEEFGFNIVADTCWKKAREGCWCSWCTDEAKLFERKNG